MEKLHALMMSNKLLSVIIIVAGILIGLFIALIVVFISNEKLLRLHPLPRNCAEYITTFYDMGRKYYGASLNEGLIEKANQIQKICVEQFPKYYPWDFQSNKTQEVTTLIECIPIAILSKLSGIPTCSQYGIRTYKSNSGYFTLDLPSGMKMIERREEKSDDGTTHGEVWFTFSKFDENNPSGLVVIYERPRIEGKGGGCSNKQGGTAYKIEMIAGQKVEVCEVDGFTAQYLRHPTKEIEYWITTTTLSREQIKIVSEAVRKTFKFSN